MTQSINSEKRMVPDTPGSGTTTATQRQTSESIARLALRYKDKVVFIGQYFN